MKSLNIIGIILIFLIGLWLLLIPVGRATIVTKTQTESPTMDTYVASDSPGVNYGGSDYLYSGIDLTFSYLYEAYLYFPLNNIPQNYTDVEISVYIFGVLTTANISVSLLNETWDEYLLNYGSKPDPQMGTTLDKLVVSSDGIYTINVTDYIEGRNNISVCLVQCCSR